VHEHAFGAQTPNYKIIQELDKKVWTFYIPPSLQVPGFSGKPSTSPLVSTSAGVEAPSLQLTMQRYTTWAIKEISTLTSRPQTQAADRCCFSNLLHASRVLCLVSTREPGGSVGRKVWALCFSSCEILDGPAKLGLTWSHPALNGLLFYQPHQELALATANDGGADVVLPHARVLLFSPCLLLLCVQGPTLTGIPDRSSWEQL